MRNLLTALILASCAALAACGGDDGDQDNNGGAGGGNDGGSGGTGGSGGAGGTGGTGGTGGAANLCGNKNIDAGEECDDGNPFDGDGCSSTCTIEAGTCDDPRKFLFVAEFAGEATYVHGGTLSGESRVNSCGSGDGADITYSYKASYNGLLQVVVGPAGRTWLSVSRACGVDGEVACVEGGEEVRLDVTRDETVYFVVDTPAATQGIEYQLAARLVPIFDEGDPCPAESETYDPNIDGACAPHLICTEVDSVRICVGPNAPVLTNASALRTGDQLQITATGVDEDKDVVAVIVSFRNDANELIPLSGVDGSPTEFRIDFNFSQAGSRSFLNSTATNSEIFLNNPEIRDAVTVDVAVLDSRELRSETMHVPLVTE